MIEVLFWKFVLEIIHNDERLRKYNSALKIFFKNKNTVITNHYHGATVADVFIFCLESLNAE